MHAHRDGGNRCFGLIIALCRTPWAVCSGGMARRPSRCDHDWSRRELPLASLKVPAGSVRARTPLLPLCLGFAQASLGSRARARADVGAAPGGGGGAPRPPLPSGELGYALAKAHDGFVALRLIAWGSGRSAGSWLDEGGASLQLAMWSDSVFAEPSHIRFCLLAIWLTCCEARCLAVARHGRNREHRLRRHVAI